MNLGGETFGLPGQARPMNLNGDAPGPLPERAAR